jgi:D-alanyl-D-alanine carboxypeptidase
MDGSVMTTVAVLPLFGALASLAALPILGLESLRSAPLEGAPAPLVGAVEAGTASAGQPLLLPVDPRFSLRLLARDVDGERDVASVNADESGEIVSTRDLLIAYTALSRLKPEYRFRTTYSARGRVTDETLLGDLIVGGRGDPTIDAIRVREVANKLAQGGVLRITGAIVLDDSYIRTGESDEVEGMNEEGEPTSLSDDDQDAGVPSSEESAPVVDLPSVPSTVRAFPFAGNRVRVVLHPSRMGGPAFVDVTPRSPFLTVKNLVKTAPHARRLKSHALLDGDRALIVIGGALAPDDPPRTLTFDLLDGAFSLGHTLNDELRRRGVKVSGRVTAADAGGYRRWLMTDFSPPLTDVLGLMLRRGGDATSGYYSESLLRVLAAESLAGGGARALGLAVVKTHLEESLHIAPSRFTLEPGKTVLPPRVIVDVLAHGTRVFELKSELEIVLGAASLHPQLALHLTPALVPRTRAVAFVDDKRADIAGYLATASGAVFAFALQVTGNGTTSVDDMWALVNRTLASLVASERATTRDPALRRPDGAGEQRTRPRAKGFAKPAAPVR